MKRILLVAAFLALVCAHSFSQSDTTYKYLSAAAKETTKDSAVSYIKFYKEGHLWHGAEYYTKKGSLKSEGNYAQPSLETASGSFDNYSEDGKLHFTAEYVDGKLVERIYYYKNGNKRSWIRYESTGTLQKGWDESGKEIKNYIVEREAKFKGGLEGWRKYMEKNLDASIATNLGAPAGDYTVEVRFVVNKEGYVSNVKAVSIPAKCKPCAGEAARVIREGPQWEHAIQHNEPVIYQAIQFVTFQVVEDKKKKD